MHLGKLMQRIRVIPALFTAVLIAGCGSSGGGGDSSSGENAATDDTAIVQAQYELVWSDEFDVGSSLLTNWNIETGYGSNGWGNDESQLYTDSPDNVSIIADPSDANNGMLAITARCTAPCDKRDDSITSGRINTKDKHAFKFGNVKARIKVPVGESTWPAFWMLGANFPDTPWPASGEIDIMEIHQENSNINTTHATVHWADADNAHTFTSDSKDMGAPLSDDFHVFEVEWTDKVIIGKIDGMPYFSRTISAAEMDEFLQEFFLILNVAIDGELGSAPNQIATTPQTMLVDWVRVYQKPTVQTFSLMPDDGEAGSAYSRVATSAGVVVDASSTDATPLQGAVATEIDFTNATDADSSAMFTYDSPLDLSDGNTFVFGMNTAGMTDFADMSVVFVDSTYSEGFSAPGEGKASVNLSAYTPTNATAAGYTAASVDDWVEYSIPLADFSGVSFDKVSAFGFSSPKDAQGNLAKGPVFIDNLHMNYDSANLSAPTSTFDDLPTPEFAAADVISIFSDVYTPINGVDYNPLWDGKTTTYATEAMGSNGDVIELTNLNFQGFDFSGNPQDLTAMTTLHMDFRTLDDVAAGATFNVKLVNFGTDGTPSEHELSFTNTTTPALASNQWVQMDIPLSDFTGLSGKDRIGQIVVSGANGLSTVYLDNIYFYGDGADGLLRNGNFESGGAFWTGNAANVVDNFGNYVNSADVALAGNPWDVNLSQSVAITQGETYKLSFKAKSETGRTLIAGIGLNEAPWTNVTQEVTLTADWQTFDLTFSAAGFGSDNSRILFDMGADVGQVLLDDVSLVVVEGDTGTGGGDTDTFDSGLLTNGSFESGAASWGGNAANVENIDGSNVNSANVETAGNPWDVSLNQVVEITQGENYTLSFKAKSDDGRTMVAGIGLNQDPWTNAVETVTLTPEWQTFTLTLSAAEFGDANSRVVFDMGADVGQVLIDEVALTVVEGGASASAGTTPDHVLFGSTAAASTELPADGIQNFGSGATFDSAYTGDSSFSPVFAVTSGDGYGENVQVAFVAVQGYEAGFASAYSHFNAKVKGSPDGRIEVKLIGAGEGKDSLVTIDLAQYAGAKDLGDGWYEISIPLSEFTNAGEIANHSGWLIGPPGDQADEPFVFLLTDVGFSGTADTGGGETGSEATNLLSNGDFEAGAESWIGNAANVENIDGTNVNSANVGAAGNPWDVNLSQVVAVTQGETYSLSFKAKSADSRTLIVGLGLNGDPWTNVTEEVTLSPDWQTFNLTFSSATFGGDNSRVIFDMGAAAGQVLIDDVVLSLSSGDSGSGNSGGGDASSPLGVFSETHTTSTVAHTVKSSSIEGWGSNPVAFDAASTAVTAADGSTSLEADWQGPLTTDWGGVILDFDAPTDVSGYSNLVFSVNTSQLAGYGDMHVKLESAAGGATGQAAFLSNNAAGATTNGDWTTYTIPMSTFTANPQMNLSELKLIGFWSPVATNASAQQDLTGKIYIDNVYFDDGSGTDGSGSSGGETGSEATNLLSNGDFEAGAENWIGNAANVENIDGTNVNSANVGAAGNPWDVNLSQVVAVTQGETYSLSFKAKSADSRTLIVGLGLNGDPWTNVTEEVTLSPDWQTFNLTFSSATFGGDNSRVIFDMGAAAGQVLIDDVVLSLSSGDSGSGNSGGGDASSPLGVFSETHTTSTVAHTVKSSSIEGWGSNPVAFDAASTAVTAADGSTSLEADWQAPLTTDWGGVVMDFAAATDVSGYSNLVFSVNTSQLAGYGDMHVKLESAAGGATGQAAFLSNNAAGTTTNGDWTTYTIPMSTFTANPQMNLSELKLIGFWSPVATNASAQQDLTGKIYIDNVYFE